MIGANRLKPLRAGYIGDGTSGGVVLHDPEQKVTIDLGYGIPTERAHELANKLDAVLQEIHEAQPRRQTHREGGLVTDRTLSDLPDAARRAIEAHRKRYDDPDTPCQGFHSLRILSVQEGAQWGAAEREICVHFHYIAEDAQEGDPPGLEVVIYGPDGAVHDAQDHG